MRQSEITHNVQILLTERSGAGLTANQIAAELKLRGAARKRLEKCLNALFQYSHEQGLASRKLKIEDLFHPSTLEFSEA